MARSSPMRTPFLRTRIFDAPVTREVSFGHHVAASVKSEPRMPWNDSASGATDALTFSDGLCMRTRAATKDRYRGTCQEGRVLSGDRRRSFPVHPLVPVFCNVRTTQRTPRLSYRHLRLQTPQVYSTGLESILMFPIAVRSSFPAITRSTVDVGIMEVWRFLIIERGLAGRRSCATTSFITCFTLTHSRQSAHAYY